MTYVPRIALMIDGQNLYYATRGLNTQIDYVKLLNWMNDRGAVQQANYYTILTEQPSERDGQNHAPMIPLVDFLSFNGYVAKTKWGDVVTTDAGRRRVKQDMTLELALDALKLAQGKTIDEMYLFSGDGFFTPLIAEVRALGIRVFIVSTRKLENQIVSDDLRKAADEFIDLADILPKISKVRA